LKYLTFRDAGVFHGHMGPFLALGYAAGRIAVLALKPESEFDLLAEIYIPLKRPYSCVIDGVQCSTKCTLGKLNLKVHAVNEIISFIFRNVKRGNSIRLKVRDYVIRRLLGFSKNTEGLSWLLEQTVYSVFEGDIPFKNIRLGEVLGFEE